MKRVASSGMAIKRILITAPFPTRKDFAKTYGLSAAEMAQIEAEVKKIMVEEGIEKRIRAFKAVKPARPARARRSRTADTAEPTHSSAAKKRTAVMVAKG